MHGVWIRRGISGLNGVEKVDQEQEQIELRRGLPLRIVIKATPKKRTFKTYFQSNQDFRRIGMGVLLSRSVNVPFSFYSACL